ncbi:hypothetical protein KCU88_g45, partial [Aureobasidium melanogenum]
MPPPSLADTTPVARAGGPVPDRLRRSLSVGPDSILLSIVPSSVLLRNFMLYIQLSSSSLPSHFPLQPRPSGLDSENGFSARLESGDAEHDQAEVRPDGPERDDDADAVHVFRAHDRLLQCAIAPASRWSRCRHSSRNGILSTGNAGLRFSHDLDPADIVFRVGPALSDGPPSCCARTKNHVKAKAALALDIARATAFECAAKVHNPSKVQGYRRDRRAQQARGDTHGVSFGTADPEPREDI